MSGPTLVRGPFASRGPFLQRGPFAGKGPFGIDSSFWDGGNLHFSQAAYDADSSANKRLATTTLLQQLLWTNAQSTSNPPMTVIGRDGTLQYAAHNLQQQSNFDPAYWTYQTNVTRGATGITDPNGGTTAVRVDWGSASTGTGVYKTNTQTIGALMATRYAWARADVAGGTIEIVDPAATVGSTVLTLSTSWQRVALTEVIGGPSNGSGVWIRKRADSPASVYLAFPQVNFGSVALDYVATGASAVYAPPISFERGASHNANVNTYDFAGWTGAPVAETVSQVGLYVLWAPSTSNSAHQIRHASSTLASSNAVHAVIAKASGYAKVGLKECQTSGNYATFDLTTGAVIASTAAKAWTEYVGPNEWRCCMVVTGAASQRMGIHALPAGYTSGDPNAYSFAGDGTSGVLYREPQLHAGTERLPYLRTFATAPLYTNGTPRSQNLVANPENAAASGWASGGSFGNIGGTTVSGSTITASTGVYAGRSVRIAITAGTCYSARINGAAITGGWEVAATWGTSGGVYISDAGAAVALGATLRTGNAPSNAAYLELTLRLNSGSSGNQCTFTNAQIWEGNADLAYVNGNGTAYSEYPQSDLLLDSVGSANSYTYSEQFDNAAWTKTRATVTANAAVAPDGQTTADKLVEDNTASATHNIARTPAFVSGTTYTHSVYAKAGERSVLILQIQNTAVASTPTAWYDLSAGVVSKATGTSTNTIEPIGGGWYRCSMTAVATASVSASVYTYLDSSPTGTGSYTGNGTSGLYLWGAQFEASATPTPYIVTTSASATRDATAIRPPSTWVTNGPQTVAMTVVPASVVPNLQVLLGRGGASYQSYLNVAAGKIFDGTNTAQASGSATAGVPNVLATRWAGSAMAACLNGGTVVSGTYDGGMDGATVGLGDDGSGGNGFRGRIKNIKISSAAANDSQLQQASSGVL